MNIPGLLRRPIVYVPVMIVGGLLLFLLLAAFFVRGVPAKALPLNPTPVVFPTRAPSAGFELPPFGAPSDNSGPVPAPRTSRGRPGIPKAPVRGENRERDQTTTADYQWDGVACILTVDVEQAVGSASSATTERTRYRDNGCDSVVDVVTVGTTDYRRSAATESRFVEWDDEFRGVVSTLGYWDFSAR